MHTCLILQDRLIDRTGQYELEVRILSQSDIREVLVGEGLYDRRRDFRYAGLAVIAVPYGTCRPVDRESPVYVLLGICNQLLSEYS